MKQKKHIGIHIIMIIASIAFIAPFLVILGSSFQSVNDLNINGYQMIPKEWSLASYAAVLKRPERMIRAYIVTIATSLVTVVGGVLITSTCAYAVSRKSYRYRGIVSTLIFIPMILNGGMIANYINIINNLGLKDNMWVLILPLLASPWYILLMKGFLSSIPDALVESAKIDGASEFGIFFRIIVPLSKPSFATISLFYLLSAWNEWYNSMLYLDDQNKVKLQYLLMKIQSSIEFLNSAEALQYGVVQAGQEIPTAGARMATCILVAGPMLIVFPFFQKYFVEGLTLGAVKG